MYIFKATIVTMSSGTQDDFLETGDNLKVVLESGEELMGNIIFTSPLKIFRSSNGIISIRIKKKLVVYNNMKFDLYGYNHKHIYGIIANGNIILEEKMKNIKKKDSKIKSKNKGIKIFTGIVAFFSAIGVILAKFAASVGSFFSFIGEKIINILKSINWNYVAIVGIAIIVIVFILLYKIFGKKIIELLKTYFSKLDVLSRSKYDIWIPSSGVDNIVSKWHNVPRENGIWKRDLRNNIAFFPDLKFKPNRFNYWIDNLKGEGRQRFTFKQLFHLSFDFVKNDKIIKKLPEYRSICKSYKHLMKGKYGIMHSKDGQIDLSRLSILSVKVDNLSSNRYGAGNNMDRAMDLMAQKLKMTKNEFIEWKDNDQIWDNSGKKLSLTLHERKDGTIDLIPHAIHGNINHDGGVSEAMRKENFDD